MATAVVLISSCMKYNEFWEPFFYFFSKAWSDCPFPVYLGTDTGSYKNITTLASGNDFGWATNTKIILNQIKEDYIVLLLEDYLLYNQVIDSKKMQDYINHMAQYNVGCLRLFPCPGPNGPWTHSKEFGIIDKGQQYRVSLQPAIWSKKTLLSLIIEGESIWDMEIKGTKRSDSLEEPFISKWRNEGIFSYVMGARKGKWTKDALDLCKKEGLK